jgi:hypothetical protein
MHYPDATGGWISENDLVGVTVRLFFLIASIFLACTAILTSSQDCWTVTSYCAVPNVRPMMSSSNGHDDVDVKNIGTDRRRHLRHNLRLCSVRRHLRHNLQLCKGVLNCFLNIRVSCTCKPMCCTTRVSTGIGYPSLSLHPFCGHIMSRPYPFCWRLYPYPFCGEPNNAGTGFRI